jgi:CheY-like chemotaxis protein
LSRTVGPARPEHIECQGCFALNVVQGPDVLNAVKSRAEEDARQPVVLVVEDEVLIRSAVAEYLRISGNLVVEAADAAEAIAVFAAGVAIDVVFSDIHMPGTMDGLSLARWIRHHHPGIRVVLTSGNADAARATEAAEMFFPKPYRTAEVAVRIRLLLAESPTSGLLKR